MAEDVLDEDKRDITDKLASLSLYDLHYNCPANGAIVLFEKTLSDTYMGSIFYIFASRVRIVRVGM